jgi:hypothetical protein
MQREARIGGEGIKGLGGGVHDHGRPLDPPRKLFDVSVSKRQGIIVGIPGTFIKDALG